MTEFKVEWPRCRIPICYSIDDGNALTPNSFLNEFAEWVLDNEMKGKFSFIPCPKGKGRIDKGIPGIENKTLGESINIVRDKIMLNFDVSPELVTHTTAWNIKKDMLMEPWGNNEDRFFSRLNKEDQIEYISFALTVLKNVGIVANGVTSPWMLNSPDYPEAILEAEKRVNNVNLTWFLLEKGEGYEIYHFNEKAGEACVHILRSCHDYIGYDEDIHYKEEMVGNYINGDGSGGRVIELIGKGVPVVILNHWSGLYCSGRKEGFRVIKETVSRIKKHVDDRIIWMRWSELAKYCVAKDKLRYKIIQKDGNLELNLDSCIECPDFTVGFFSKNKPEKIMIDDQELYEIDKIKDLSSDRWTYQNKRIYVTFTLKKRSRISIGSAPSR